MERSAAERRAVPNYDGRDAEPLTAGEVLLYIPRVLLSPLYLVSEYLIRRPLGALVSSIERGDAAPWLIDLFDFRTSRDVGFVPTAYFEFGFRFNVGFYLYVDNQPFEGNHFRIHAATGGIEYLKLTLVDRIPLGRGATLAIRGHGSRRQDYLFAGLGPETRTRQRARYGADRLEGSIQLDVPSFRSSRLVAESGVRRVAFREGTCCGDATLGEQVDAGMLSVPPGFEEGYAAYHQGLMLAIDSRDTEEPHGAGVRVELFAEHAFDLHLPLERRWLKYGAHAGVISRIRADRTLALSVAVRLVDPLGSAAVPFNEQSLLDGETMLRGFRQGRLHGRSAFAATLEYRWPVWVWLDGAFQAAVGNAYGPHLSGVDDPGNLRASFSLGLKTVGRPDHAFYLLAAFGTETVDQGLGLTSGRLLVGAISGF